MGGRLLPFSIAACIQLSHADQENMDSLVWNGSDKTTIRGQHGSTRRSLALNRRFNGLEERSRDTCHTDESLPILRCRIFVVGTVLNPVPSSSAHVRSGLCETHLSVRIDNRCTLSAVPCRAADCSRICHHLVASRPRQVFAPSAYTAPPPSAACPSAKFVVH